MIRLPATKFDGTETVLQIKDLGRRIRIAKGRRREVYTTKYTADSITRYSRVDAALVDVANDRAEFRLQEDKAVLETMGIDPASLGW